MRLEGGGMDLLSHALSFVPAVRTVTLCTTTLSSMNTYTYLGCSRRHELFFLPCFVASTYSDQSCLSVTT